MKAAVADAPPARTGHFTEIQLDEIVESLSNPRKRFGDLDELAASIRQVGVLEPLIVRPHPTELEGYELVAGARRFRAAEIAGLVDVPCLVRTLTDVEVLEIQVTENLQRKDVHPLEEADSYAALMKADPAYTVEAVAHRVGRSASYVYQRLKLRTLIPDARTAFDQDEITAAHAVRLARLTPADQERALPECFYDLFGDQQGRREVRPVSRLDGWIKDHTKVDVADRETVQHYLPELHQQLEGEAEPAATLLQLSESSMPGHFLDKDHGLIGQGRWKELKGASCKDAKRGVVVHGGPLRVVWVCAKKGCPKHWPAAKPAAKGKAAATRAPKYDYEAEQRKREEERKRFEALRTPVMIAVAKTFAETKWDDALMRRVVELATNADEDIEGWLLAAGYRIGVKHAAPVFAFLMSFDRMWQVDQLRALAKKHKVDVKAIEKELAADATADADALAAADANSPIAPGEKKRTSRNVKAAKKAGRK